MIPDPCRSAQCFSGAVRLRSLPIARAVCAFSFAVLLLIPIAASPAHPNQRSQGQPYALIFGTVFGPDSRPLYGVLVKVRRADKKKAQWELMSDHRGEFAQRVPPGPADYIVWTEVKLSKPGGKEKENSKNASNEEKANTTIQDKASPSAARGTVPGGREVKVHVENDERVDIGLHLTN